MPQPDLQLPTLVPKGETLTSKSQLLQLPLLWIEAAIVHGFVPVLGPDASWSSWRWTHLAGPLAALGLVTAHPAARASSNASAPLILGLLTKRRIVRWARGALSADLQINSATELPRKRDPLSFDTRYRGLTLSRKRYFVCPRYVASMSSDLIARGLSLSRSASQSSSWGCDGTSSIPRETGCHGLEGTPSGRPRRWGYMRARKGDDARSPHGKGGG